MGSAGLSDLKSFSNGWLPLRINLGQSLSLPALWFSLVYLVQAIQSLSLQLKLAFLACFQARTCLLFLCLPNSLSHSRESVLWWTGKIRERFPHMLVVRTHTYELPALCLSSLELRQKERSESIGTKGGKFILCHRVDYVGAEHRTNGS